MFKNALVGVDGRPNGRDAIALATRLTDPDAKLTLAHVHTGNVHPLHAITPGLVAEERQASGKLLEEERTAGEVSSAELVTVEAATPGAGLHRRAEAQGADVLVLGSCGRGLVGRAMLGDDTRAALNGSPCAVAIAAARLRRAAAAAGQDRRRLQRHARGTGGPAKAKELATVNGSR